MGRVPIEFGKLRVNIHRLWGDDWLLLTAGDFASGRFNTMTVSWGSLGVMWNRPFVQVVVRPGRHTYTFMEEHDAFTLCSFPESCRGALELLGTHSGRTGDKIRESGLTPIASSRVAAPSFEQAALILECRKLYWQDMEPSHFLDAQILENYPAHDYHRIYYGQVMAILGEPSYAA